MIAEMFSLEIECDADDRELLIADLWDHHSAGIVELSNTRVRAFFEDTEDRNDLQELFPGSTLREEEERDWVQSSREMLQPMEVGSRFYLVPEWRDDPTPAGRLRIAVNPGMAFGTGVHETTRLCLEALEEFVKPGMRVLDVGTGSGILAHAAGLLGAAKVYACDTDPIALEIARNGFIGSVDAVAPASVDIVVANISPEAILQLAGDLVRVLRPGGILLASGFENHEVDLVKAGLPPAREARHKGNWALVITSTY
jgi:ribosomal protein L11 methyltransferase